MGLNKEDFAAKMKELKRSVGVIDVALALGYSFKEKAGKINTSKWLEMVKGSANSVADVIVVSNAGSKEDQFYFRRNNSGGDAISLIRENISSFNVGEGSEWHKVINILSDLANRPRPEALAYYDTRNNAANISRVLDTDRYKLKPLEYQPMRRLLEARGLSESTAMIFSPFLCAIKDNNNTKFKGYNLGFPFTEPGSEKAVGYEIRGVNGFKSKAAGGNSSTASWIADFASVNGCEPKRVYCFESGYDAMAFYQRNANQIDLKSSVFISTGGQVGALQLNRLFDQYPGCKFVDCFDNDPAGRAYACRLALAKANIAGVITVIKEGACPGVSIDKREEKIFIPFKEANADGIQKALGVSVGIESRIAPEGFKDWNDVLLGRRSGGIVSQTKYARDENLARRRGCSLHC